ncbi:hypothetical protein BME31_19410 [Klebsiella quasipneumoniae subsp. similipneumoniae]|nr:hypothetical protein AM459_10105 [Klebsiella pneumoniae]NBZ43520.1 hypothetical protein [Klebsiella quasipneumoniae]OVX29584.1 hypothetical protein BME31_19410 [Klebsiella quasipneumoniae subsp. similipneumoniae]
MYKMMRQVNYSQDFNTLYNLTTLPLCQVYNKINVIRSHLISQRNKIAFIAIKWPNSAAMITLYRRRYCMIVSPSAITNH